MIEKGFRGSCRGNWLWDSPETPVYEVILMQCPKCGREMEKGKLTFFTAQGYTLLSFTPVSEAEKGFFKRKTVDKMILAGQEAEGWHCGGCKLLLPLLTAD